MATFTRSSFLGYCIVLLLCLTQPASASEPAGSLAPVNPQFLQHFEKDTGIAPAAKTTLFSKETGARTFTLGALPSPIDRSYLKGKTILRALAATTFPASFDLRLTGKLSPVRDQAQCGSCWAFASIGSLESSLLPNEPWDFSENNLNNTNGFDFGPCNGGTGDMAIAYFSRWSGPILESDDPYNPQVVAGSSLPANQIYPSPTGLSVRKHVQEMQLLPPRVDPLDNSNIKQALMDHGAVEVSIYWQADYYNDAHKSYYYSGSKAPNHAVAIVGWIDDYDKSNFATPPPGNGAFIVRNSWGSSFGEGGYFYLSYYDTVVATDSPLVFIGTTGSNTEYSRIYQYDYLGQTSSFGFDTDTAWFANVFTASADEQVTAVSFYTPTTNSSYAVSVYKQSAGGPVTGTLAASAAGTLPIPGYHTITLPAPVSLASGEKFSVVVKLTTPGYTYPVPVEAPVRNYSSQARAQAGESFVSNNGTYWWDLTTTSPDTNVCLKALATSSTACSFSLSNSSHSFPAAGGSDSVTITASSGNCPWTVSSGASWITLTSATQGNGTSTVTYSIAPNATPASRSGTIVIGGQTFTVIQSGGAPVVTNLVVNPGFESGKEGWTVYDNLGYDVVWRGWSAHSGNWFLWLGGDNFINDYAYQDVAVPADATQAAVRFWYRISTEESSTSKPYDIMTVRLDDPASNTPLATLATLSNVDDTNYGWVQSPWHDLTAYRGRTVRLVFAAVTDGSHFTSFKIDDVELASASGTIVSPTVPGVPTAVSASAGNGEAVVSFSPPASDGGSPITGYTVLSNPAGGVDSNAGSLALSHTVRGLSNGTAYTFTVTATNAAGSGPASPASNSVIPGGVAAPTASFTSKAVAGSGGYNVRFTDQSQRAASWLWNFGDGATSGEQNPSHAYAKRGVYTVTLTASNATGSSTVSRNVKDYVDITGIIQMMLGN